MAKKEAKKAVDTGQVQVPEQGTDVSENENLPADIQQEEQDKEVPDAGMQQLSPTSEMNVPEIMNPLKETPEASGAASDAGMQQPFPDPEDDQQKEQIDQVGWQNVKTFMITCRNKISKVIGGVSFVNGVGYTSDGFTASWFGNKDGYEVREAGS